MLSLTYSAIEKSHIIYILGADILGEPGFLAPSQGGWTLFFPKKGLNKLSYLSYGFYDILKCWRPTLFNTIFQYINYSYNSVSPTSIVSLTKKSSRLLFIFKCFL